MSQKLIIILAVQSALVLGIGGVALGMNAGAHDEPAPHSKKAKKKKPPPVAEDEGEDVAEPDAPAHGAKAHGKPAHAEAVEEATRPEAPAKEHAEPGPKEHAEPVPPREEEPKGHGKEPKKTEPAHGAPSLALKEPSAPKDPLEAFAWLDEGNTRWTQGHVKSRDLVALREGLARRFEPWAMVVSCGDGRAVPEAVFDTGPGTVVTVSAPSLEPTPALMTSVERSLKQFTPKVVVILGHAGCGKADPSGVVTTLAGKVMGGKAVRKRLEASQLLVLRATYDLSTGRVRWLDSEEGDGHPQASASDHH